MGMTEMSNMYFIIIEILFVGFFLIEGIAYGVGIMLPMMTKSEEDREQFYEIIGPGWKSNQIWMLLIAFVLLPKGNEMIAKVMYIALAVMILALFLRGIAVQLRTFDDTFIGRVFDKCILLESFITPLLWGVVIGNFLQWPNTSTETFGLAFIQQMFNTYSMLLGVAFLFVSIFYGGLYVAIATRGALAERGRATSLVMGVILALLLSGLVGSNGTYTPIGNSFMAKVIFGISALAFLLAWVRARTRHVKSAFFLTVIMVITFVGTYVLGAYPLMVKYLNANLTLLMEYGTYTLIILVALGIGILARLVERWKYYKKV